MSGSPIISGLMIFFSLTTLAVIAYPIVKVLPSRLERSVYRKISFNRDAIAALDSAAARTVDPEQRERLRVQSLYHRSALAALAPNDPLVLARAPGRIDTAA